MRILFTTPILQHPAAGGPFLRIENSIKALSSVAELYLHCRSTLESIGGEEGLAFYKGLCKEFRFSAFARQGMGFFARSAVNMVSNKTIGRDVFELGKESEKDYRELIEVADSIKADVIWLGYGNISYPLLKYIKGNSKYKTVLDTDSVWSRFVLRGLPYAATTAKRAEVEKRGRAKEEEEGWGTRLSDVTTAVSEVDAQYYRSLARDASQVRIFSNVIDMDTYAAPCPSPEGFKKPCIYLAGSFGPKSPMDDAARWTIGKVMPVLRKKLPGIHFYIAGSGSDTTLSDVKDTDITITGKLSSVLPYLKNADVSIVPLRFESGTRFKILEAGACGIPIVSTTLGAEGIPVEDGRDIVIADTPEEFAEGILKIIRNSEFGKGLAENCKGLIEMRYSIPALAQEAREILRHIDSFHHM